MIKNAGVQLSFMKSEMLANSLKITLHFFVLLKKMLPAELAGFFYTEEIQEEKAQYLPLSERNKGGFNKTGEEEWRRRKNVDTHTHTHTHLAGASSHSLAERMRQWKIPSVQQSSESAENKRRRTMTVHIMV